jgi:hypothetical protein
MRLYQILLDLLEQAEWEMEDTFPPNFLASVIAAISVPDGN